MSDPITNIGILKESYESRFDALSNEFNGLIKTKRFTGTLPTDPETFVAVEHGVDTSKLYSFSIVVDLSESEKASGISLAFPPNFVSISVSDEYLIVYVSTTGDSSGVFGKTFRIVILYEE